MRSFTGAILTGGVSACDFHDVTGIFKKVDDGFALTQLSALVETNIFTRDVLTETILGQPLIEILDGRPLVGETSCIQSTCGMVSDQAILHLTIKPYRPQETIRVLRLLNNEPGVDGDPLIALSGMTGIRCVAIGTAQFSTGANWALIKIVSHGDGRDTISRVMSTMDATVV
jgi:hypothetical protein